MSVALMPSNCLRIAAIAEPVLKNHPIVRAYLFGSQARGEQSSGGDVDLYCPVDRTKPFGMFALGSLIHDLQAALNTTVDVVTAEDLEKTNPRFYQEIERDKVQIYERTPFQSEG